MMRSLLIEKEKMGLIHALTRLIQSITLILLVHVIHAGLSMILGILHFLVRLNQPGLSV